ncbi:MAG: hypothetical protein OXI95_19775 [bacterium]|nr:hypothetical protein [bacterium]
MRTPLVILVEDLAVLAGLLPRSVVMVGESRLDDIKTRPDYAVIRGVHWLHRGEGARGGSCPPPFPRPTRPGAAGDGAPAVISHDLVVP